MSDWTKTAAELKCLLDNFKSDAVTPEKCQPLLLKIYEGFLQQELGVIKYICELYGKIRARKTLPTIQNLMSGKLPGNYDDVLYFLRVYALFGACADATINISVRDLEGFSSNSKLIGKYAVIDFILTRDEISWEQRKLLAQLKKNMPKSTISGARDKELARITHNMTGPDMIGQDKTNLACLKHQQLEDAKLFLSSFLKNPLHWPSHNVNSDHISESVLNGNDEGLKTGLSGTLANDLEALSNIWPLTTKKTLNEIILKHEISDHEERLEIIRKLKGLIRTNSDKAIIVKILSVAIQLEDPLSNQNAILGHVWRLVRVMKHFPKEDFRALYIGLKAYFVHRKSEPQRNLLAKDELIKCGKLMASLIHAIDYWDRIADLFDDHKSDTSTPFLCRCIIQVISVGCSELTNNISLPVKNAFDRLMVLGMIDKMKVDKVVELEWAYCTVINRPFDSDQLKNLITEADATIKARILTLLVKGSVSEPAEAYLWCRELSKLGNHTPETLDLFKELLFLDLDPQLCKDEQMFPDRCITVADIYPMWRSLKDKAKNTVRLMDFLLFAWRKLRDEGCHNDALGILFQIWRFSNATWGPKSLRTVLCQDILKRYAGYLKLDISTYHSVPQEELEVPSSLQKSFDLCKRTVDRPIFGNHEFEQFKVQFDMFLASLNSSQLTKSLTMPELSHRDVESSKASVKTSEVIQKLVKEAQNVKDLTWDERLVFTRKLRHLQLLAAMFKVNLDQDYALCFYENLGSPLYQSRAHYSEKPYHADNRPLQLPPDTICVCLDFDDDRHMVVRRYEPGFADPLTVRLCVSGIPKIENRPMEADWQFSTVLSNIDQIIERSLNTEKSYSLNSEGAEEFWKDQLDLDHELYRYLRMLEPAWFGGFVGLLSSEIMFASRGLEALLSQCLSKNSTISITPAFANLLHFASRHPKSPKSAVGSLLKNEFPDLERTTIREVEQILSHAPEPPPPIVNRGIVLVCDKASANIPWESLAVLRRQRVTRALSLAHLQELIDFRKTHPPAPLRQVTYLINPDKNLPPTHVKTLEFFEKCGWEGTANRVPELSDFLEQIRAATDFIYIGHGSGQSTLRSHSLRKMYISPSNVYLFGCSSVATHRSSLDNDRLTDYAIKGSQVIMGCLWKVKDKEINYFCHSFLRAVFEKNLAVGEALQLSRTRCKLPYLTGAACVVYGLPYPQDPSQS